MADVNISKYRASVVRDGSKPATPGFVVSEGQDPVDPAGTGQNHLPVTIAPTATGLSITDSQILSGAGTVGQYIRGDGSLADFPSASGGGSSVSYYLNGSVNQGTIGGVAYKELSKVPVLGTGTDFSINANGYIASFITDAGDPNLLEIPGGNWNFETYFSASSSGGTPTFYVELYKYNGTTFTLLASNSGSPELIAFGTTLTSYFSTLAVPTTTLALTDRLAIRYYVNHSGRTITLHTEDNHLCQVITTFTTGLTALNGLTAQVQNFAVGTSGTDFNISSATATHTFNLPTASGTNRGALSSADWTTFNNKQNALGYVPVPETRTLTINGTAFDLSANRSWTVGDVRTDGSYSNPSWITALAWSKITGTPTTLSGYGITDAVPSARTLTINGVTQDLSANRTFNVGTVTSVGLSSATSGVTIGGSPVTGVGAFTLTIATASGSQQGLLSASDWTTFNNKQNALTNPVTGTGTTNYLAKFTGSTTVGNSQVFDNGTNVGIGTALPNNLLTIIGNDPSQVSIEASSGNTNSQINLKPSGTGIAYIKNQANTGFAFGTNNTEAMRLSANGNLLVGTTSDNGARLQVSGEGRFTNSDGADLIRYAATGVNTNFATKIVSGANDVLVFRRQHVSVGGLDIMSLGFNGNVGIGTSSPTTRLFVKGIGLYEGIVIDNSSTTGGGYFGAYQNGTQRAVFGVSATIEGGTSSDAAIFAETGGALRFYVNGSATSAMRLFSTGNLSIGSTTDTSYRLFVNGNTYIRSGGNTSGSFGLVVQDSSANNLFLIRNDGAATFSSSVTAGDLISTSYGTARIQITSTANNTNAGLRFTAKDSGGTSKNSGLYYVAGTNTSNTFLSLSADDNNYQFNVLANGNVGIGTSSPTTYSLSGTHVENFGGSTYAFIHNNTTTVKSFYATNESAGLSVLYTFSNHPLLFGTNNTERMRITSSGNVLIGTTTDNSHKLRVNGTGYFDTGIKTGNPVGSTTNDWLLGRALVSGTSTPDRWIRVQIGNLYYDILAVYMGSV